jgi:competence ComEA-like helix-hairpin-helix protein
MSEKMDINTATAEEIAQVRLITPKRAEQIVDWRDNTHGPISDLNELEQLPGIGHRTVENMAEMFSASGTQEDEDPGEGAPGGPTEEDEGEGEEDDENGDEGEEEGEEESEEDGDGEDGDPDDDKTAA